MEARTSYLDQVLGENPEARLAIREVPHFRGCSDALVNLVYHYGRIFSLRHNEELTRENEFDQWVFFVLSGRLLVALGDEVVDTISSSLVGERCLLGEPRRATLRAAEGGIVALGVDMALMDALQKEAPPNGNGAAVNNLEVLVELLAIITGEVVQRVARLSLNQIDISQKYENVRNAENLATVVAKLENNEFLETPRANIEIFKFLFRTDRGLLALCRGPRGGPGSTTVDTRKLLAACINGGRYEMISDLAVVLNRVIPWVGNPPHFPVNPFEGRNFQDFSDRARGAVNDHLESGPQTGGARPFAEGEWSRHFRLDEELALDLAAFCGWLAKGRGLSPGQVMGVLTVMLGAASEYTALINASLKQQVQEMSATALLAKLERVNAAPEGFLLEYINTSTPEELIPLFSKHVLDVHLVNPYLEKVPPAPAGPGEAPAPPPGEGDGQAMADNLFD